MFCRKSWFEDLERSTFGKCVSDLGWLDLISVLQFVEVLRSCGFCEFLGGYPFGFSRCAVIGKNGWFLLMYSIRVIS